MPGSISMLARNGGPLEAVRREQRRAAITEARFQIARLAAIDLAQEEPEQRALARAWLRQLREIASAVERASPGEPAAVRELASS